MYHIGVMARLREGQKSNEDPFVIKSALGASAGALGKIKVMKNALIFDFKDLLAPRIQKKN